MAHPSSRITGLTGGGSDGWDVFYRARAMVRAGTPVIELTIGEHDTTTHPKILDAMHASALAGNTGYALTSGLVELRETVAARVEKRTGVPTTMDNVLITPGGQAGLFASHMAACAPGDVALYCDPYYATYPGTLRSVGAQPRVVPCHPSFGFQPQESDLAAAAKGATSLLINSPNNPTGVVYSEETLNGLARVVRDHDLWLISDEVYDTQVWDGAHLSPRALPDMVDRTLVVGSMSKSHAMTGSRVGWVVGPEEMIEHMISLATNTTYGVPGFLQEASVFALNQGQALEDDIAAPFRRRRDAALALLSNQQLVKAVPPDGAMYLMLDIRATGMGGEDFANALLDTRRIAVMPGESFGNAAAGHIRVAMTVEDSAFLDALSQILDFAAERAA